MAQYNADIRIGVTGKAQLNQLEAQLKRTQTQLNKLNKSLQLRTRVQAIRLDTRAANTAIKQLEQRINKLGRTINVNLRVNEREGRKSKGSSSTVISTPQQETKQQASALAVAAAQQRRLKDSQREQLKIQKQINPLIEQQARLQGEIANQVAKISKNRAGAQNAKNLKNQGAQLNRLNFGYDALIRKLNRLRSEYKGVTGEVRKLEGASRSASDQQVIAAEKRRQRVNDLRLEKKNAGKFGKGFGAGAGLAGTSALGNIPVLSETVTGGLVAGLSGASVAAGALGGALVGLGAAAVAVTADTTAFNNQLGLMRRALANTVSTTDELETALAGIRGVSEDFLVPIGDATEQFTKLNAAARASGFTVEEVEEVYRGLAAANVALGGDSQKLQGILLATQQVFSKGKVQAEELRGQIGERLAGAFAKFAESAGLSTSQLDKALENGEVSLEDFVRFAKSLLDEYEEDAKKLADAPENAGTRLKIAMDNLREAMGPITQDIGNMFTNMATEIINGLTAAVRAAQRVPLEIAKAQRDAAVDDFRLADKNDWNFSRVEARLQRAVKNYNERKAAYDALGMTDLTPTGNPPGSRNQNEPDTNTGGSKSGPRDTTAELKAAIALEKELLRIEKQRGDLSGLLGDLREQDLQRQEIAAELQERLAVIQTQNITAESKSLAGKLAELQAERELQQVKNATAGIIEEATRTSVEGARELIESTNLVAANEQRRKELLEQGINPALADALIEVENQYAEKRKILNVDIELLENALLQVDAESEIAKKLKERLDLLKKIKGELDENEGTAKDNAKNDNPGKLEAYMNQLKTELADTEGMIVSLAQTVETELSRAMSTAIVGLIDGTTKAEEAFAQMFRSIGQAFIDMATQMIAKALVMKALGILFPGANGGGGGGIPGGGLTGSSGGWTLPGDAVPKTTPLSFFAKGGYVTGPTMSMIGEGGESEYVIPESKMNSAMSRYHHGNRGQAVVGGPSYEEGVALGGENTTVNYTGPILTFNSEDYVPKSAVDEIINRAAQKGAAAGQTRAMNSLRNSRSQRSKVGL